MSRPRNRWPTRTIVRAFVLLWMVGLSAPAVVHGQTSAASAASAAVSVESCAE